MPYNCARSKTLPCSVRAGSATRTPILLEASRVGLCSGRYFVQILNPAPPRRCRFPGPQDPVVADFAAFELRDDSESRKLASSPARPSGILFAPRTTCCAIPQLLDTARIFCRHDRVNDRTGSPPYDYPVASPPVQLNLPRESIATRRPIPTRLPPRSAWHAYCRDRNAFRRPRCRVTRSPAAGCRGQTRVVVDPAGTAPNTAPRRAPVLLGGLDPMPN